MAPPAVSGFAKLQSVSDYEYEARGPSNWFTSDLLAGTVLSESVHSSTTKPSDGSKAVQQADVAKAASLVIDILTADKNAAARALTKADSIAYVLLNSTPLEGDSGPLLYGPPEDENGWDEVYATDAAIGNIQTRHASATYAVVNPVTVKNPGTFLRMCGVAYRCLTKTDDNHEAKIVSQSERLVKSLGLLDEHLTYLTVDNIRTIAAISGHARREFAVRSAMAATCAANRAELNKTHLLRTAGSGLFILKLMRSISVKNPKLRDLVRVTSGTAIIKEVIDSLVAFEVYYCNSDATALITHSSWPTGKARSGLVFHLGAYARAAGLNCLGWCTKAQGQDLAAYWAGLYYAYYGEEIRGFPSSEFQVAYQAGLDYIGLCDINDSEVSDLRKNAVLRVRSGAGQQAVAEYAADSIY